MFKTRIGQPSAILLATSCAALCGVAAYFWFEQRRRHKQDGKIDPDEVSSDVIFACVCWCAVSGYAEDPTLYLDANGIIHMIAHGVYDFSVLQILVH